MSVTAACTTTIHFRWYKLLMKNGNGLPFREGRFAFPTGNRKNRLKRIHAEIDRWTADFCKLKDRFQRHPEPLTEEDIKNIYLRSLAPFIVD